MRSSVFHSLRISGILAVTFCFVSTIAIAQRSSGMYAPRVRSVSITVEGGIAILGCDLTSLSDNYYVEPMGGFEIGYNASSKFKIGFFATRGGLTAKKDEDEAACTFNIIGATGHYYFRLLYGKVNPYVVFRAGGIFGDADATIRKEKISKSVSGGVFGGGIGIEFHPKSSIGLRLQATSFLTTTDELDALDAGRMQDGFTTFSAGITYYFSLRR